MNTANCLCRFGCVVVNTRPSLRQASFFSLLAQTPRDGERIATFRSTNDPAVLRTLTDGELVRPLSANASTVKALKERVAAKRIGLKLKAAFRERRSCSPSVTFGATFAAFFFAIVMRTGFSSLFR